MGCKQAASYVSTKEALDISQSLGYNFSTTGHSLGAWLAELSLYFCHKNFEYHQVKTVTFDSPRSKDQMVVFKSNVDNTETKIRANSIYDDNIEPKKALQYYCKIFKRILFSQK